MKERNRDSLNSDLAKEIYDATVKETDFDQACLNVGLNVDKFVEAMQECFPESSFKVFTGLDDRTCQLMRVMMGNGVIIGMQIQQNRIFNAVDDEPSVSS